MMYNKIKISLWSLLIIVGFFILGCQPSNNQYMHLTGGAQGTSFSIKYKSPESIDYSHAIDSIFKVIDLSMSTYIPQSIISRINNGETDVVLDEHFVKVFNLSKQVYQESNGFFDPTVGLLVNAYGFGPKELPENLKDVSINELMKYVGLDKLTIENNRLIKTYQETYIDFNAIAQGYSVDVIKGFLRAHHVVDFMIEVGGEIYAQGKNPQGNVWQIGIQNPETDSQNNIEKIISLQHHALATSGNYRKFKIDENGNKFVHTINPKTGQSIPSNLLSATVITDESCALADAYATAFMAMGYERSKDFLKSHSELETFLIYADNESKILTSE